jgi:hypothetical protein
MHGNYDNRYVVDDKVSLPGFRMAIIKGYHQGATTNFDGEFLMTLPSDTVLVFFSSLLAQKFPLTDKTSFNITCEAAAEQ